MSLYDNCWIDPYEPGEMTTSQYFTPTELRDLISSIEEKRYDVRRKGGFILGPMDEDAQKRNDQLTRLLAKLKAPCMY